MIGADPLASSADRDSDDNTLPAANPSGTQINACPLTPSADSPSPQEDAPNPQKGFAKQLDKEFKEFKKQVPVIGRHFDPEEELRNLIKKWRDERRNESKKGDSRRDLIKEFERYLYCQEFAWAMCRQFIERIIKENPDVERGVLEGWINKFATPYGFTEPQKGKAAIVLDNYYKQHQTVKEFCQKHVDLNATEAKEELLSQMPGFDEKIKLGEIEITDGPICFIVKCSQNIVDSLYTGSRVKIYQGDYIISGFSTQCYNIPFICIARSEDEVKSKLVIKHETQHQINGLFRKQFETDYSKQDALWEEYLILIKIISVLKTLKDAKHNITIATHTKKSEEIEKELISEIFRAERNHIKNEISARTSEGGDPSYYLLCNEEISPYTSNINYWQECLYGNPKFDDAYKKYISTIKKAINATDRLAHQNPNMEPELAIYILTYHRLPEWNRATCRFIRQGWEIEVELMNAKLEDEAR